MACSCRCHSQKIKYKGKYVIGYRAANEKAKNNKKKENFVCVETSLLLTSRLDCCCCCYC